MNVGIKIIMALLLLISSMELDIKMRDNSIPLNYSLFNWKRPREIKIEKNNNYDLINELDGNVFYSSKKDYDTKDNRKKIPITMITKTEVANTNVAKEEKDIRRLEDPGSKIEITIEATSNGTYQYISEVFFNRSKPTRVNLDNGKILIIMKITPYI